MSVTPYPVRLPDGTAFQVCLSDADQDPISAAVRGGHYYHDGHWPLFQGFFKPGGVVVDLGVHVGVFTLAAAAAGCRVLAVEANPRNVALVQASIAANGFAHVRLAHRAVGDGPGEVMFECNGPYGHVAAGHPGSGAVRVPVAAVDDLLADGWSGRVDLVKMDIEGSEVGGVRGMAGLLARADAPPVFYESNAHTLRLFGQTAPALRAEFARHGYRSYLIDYGRRTLSPVGEADCQPECCIDYLAVKVGPDGAPALPPGLAGWSIAPAPTATEIVARFREVMRHANERPHVEHLARELAVAPDYVRNDQFVVAYVASHTVTAI